MAWNIRAGGTGRTAGIVERLEALGADVAVVGDVPPNGAGAKLRGYLLAAGFEHQVAVEAPPRAAGMLVAARAPIAAGEVGGAPVPATWLHVDGLPFELGAVYVPRPDGDLAGADARERSLAWLSQAVAGWRDRPALLCGDLHTDPPGSDGEAAGGQLADLLEDGWRDLARDGQGDVGERTWAGRDGAPAASGHALGSPKLSETVAVGHAGAAGLTQHRPLVVDVAC